MGAGKIITGIGMVVQTALAVALLVIVSTKLDKYSLSTLASDLDAAANGQALSDTTCLLGSNQNGLSNCLIAYIWSSVSLAATLAFGLLMFFSCGCCGLGFLLDGVFGAAGTVWWALAAVSFNYAYNQPLTAAYPQGDWRTSAVSMAWALTAVFGLIFLTSVVRLFSKCCGCCGGDDSSRKERDIEAADAHVVVLPVSVAPKGEQQFVRGDAPYAQQQAYWTTAQSGQRA